MDCEECEFHSLLNENNSTIKMFSEIFMEYHNKPYALISKLSILKLTFRMNLDPYPRISQLPGMAFQPC